MAKKIRICPLKVPKSITQICMGKGFMFLKVRSFFSPVAKCTLDVRPIGDGYSRDKQYL
jgi:hypothetical protein